MKYREVARKLRALGCEEAVQRGSGSHQKWRNLASDKGTVVPDWGNADLRSARSEPLFASLALIGKISGTREASLQ
jgi:predicted RNA binding protein YcfA (HicA-like mRNA interferase family)